MTHPWNLLILIGEIVLLSYFSGTVTRLLFTLFLLLFRARSIAISILSFILFPGTIIHELAHLFTAEILGVRTGKLTLAPEFTRIAEENLQTGSVAIADTDPLRRAIIGLAPFFTGLISIIGLTYFLSLNEAVIRQLFQGIYPATPLFIGLIVAMYALFIISVSMFPSKVDLKGTFAVGVTIFLLLIAAFFIGIRISLTGKALEQWNSGITLLDTSLGFTLALQIVVVLLLMILVAITRKVTKPAHIF